jgi:hypothetical protein
MLRHQAEQQCYLIMNAGCTIKESLGVAASSPPPHTTLTKSDRQQLRMQGMQVYYNLV